ncbi:CDGSH iron-sulfur domain-containing protein [Kitasatospora sp. NPDC097691]|uniref:CDGSH iron-sulfur domain-containing protein n=1 Tax=Kitasatospora sp. NPDC097691 TaxID=3157231 RepID=UPI00332BB014
MSANADRDATRVVVVPGGPLLVEGPVEVVLPDGTVRVSERPVVALCACRRSRTYPFCDTSHRRRGRPARGPEKPRGSGPAVGQG